VRLRSPAEGTETVENSLAAADAPARAAAYSCASGTVFAECHHQRYPIIQLSNKRPKTMHEHDYKYADFDHSPLMFYYEVTQACDLVCKHCRASANLVHTRWNYLLSSRRH
jgi:hypothetical protein